MDRARQLGFCLKILCPFTRSRCCCGHVHPLLLVTDRQVFPRRNNKRIYNPLVSWAVQALNLIPRLLSTRYTVIDKWIGILELHSQIYIEEVEWVFSEVLCGGFLWDSMLPRWSGEEAVCRQDHRWPLPNKTVSVEYVFCSSPFLSPLHYLARVANCDGGVS